MKKLDRFILKSFIGPFVAILLIVVFILAMQTLWLYIDELVGKGLGIRTILEFLFWGVCSLALPLALPLATLLASTMTVGQLAERSELMAIRAAGISVGRVMAPLAVAAAIIAGGTYLVCSRLVPHAFNEIYTLRDDIARTKDEIKIPPGTFYNGIDGYILRVGDQDKVTKMLYDVQVYDHTAHKGNISVTMADSAILKLAKSKEYLTFTLFHGSTYREDNTLRYNDTSLVLQHIDFARQELLIPLKNYSFEKSDSARFDDAIKSKQMAELRHLSDSLRHELDSIHNVNYKMVRHNTAFQQIKQLDTAFYNPDRSYFSSPEYLHWDGPDAAAQARIRAADNVARFNSDINSFRFFLAVFPAEEVRIGEELPVGVARSRIQLPSELEGGGAPDLFVVDPVQGVQLVAQRVTQVPEFGCLLGLDLVVEAGGIRLLETIVLERDQKLLPGKVDVLQHEARVVVAQGVVLAVGGAVVEGESQVFLAFGHLEDGGVGDGDGDVALVGGVVIDLHAVEHLAVLVLVVHPEDVAFDAVVEGPGRDLDLILGLGDVVAQGVDLVEGVGHHVRTDDVGADGDQGGSEGNRDDDAAERDAGGLDRHQFGVLGQLADGHRGREQGRERQRQGERQAAHPPEQEFQDGAQSESLAYQLVDVEPEGLHHQDENHDEQDRDERSDEGFQYEAVELFHPGMPVL